MTQGSDTRIALVREDTFEERFSPLLEAIIPFATELITYGMTPRILIALRAELFPETDKSLKAKHLQAITAPFDGSERWASLEDIRDGASRIEEELNRG